jgi:hypothetical protein
MKVATDGGNFVKGLLAGYRKDLSAYRKQLKKKQNEHQSFTDKGEK